MIRLSIIVPAIGEQAKIDATLISVLENRPSNCEVIVPCAESYQDPYDLSDEVRFIVSPDTAPVSVLLNRGIANSSSERVHWLTPGILATDGWTESPLRLIGEGKTNFVAPLVLDESNPNRIESAGVRFTRGGSRKTIGQNVRHPSRKSIRLRVDGPSLQTGFGRTESLIGIGGFRSAFGPDLADADLAARIKACGETCIVDTSCCLLGRPEAPSSYGFRRGITTERLYWQHVKSNGMMSLVNHSGHVAIDTLKLFPRLSAVTTLIGRLVGAATSLRPVDDIDGTCTPIQHQGNVETTRRAA